MQLKAISSVHGRPQKISQTGGGKNWRSRRGGHATKHHSADISVEGCYGCPQYWGLSCAAEIFLDFKVDISVILRI